MVDGCGVVVAVVEVVDCFGVVVAVAVVVVSIGIVEVGIVQDGIVQVFGYG